MATTDENVDLITEDEEVEDTETTEDESADEVDEDEEQDEVQDEDEEDEPEEDEEEEEAPKPKPLSRRAQLRIQTLMEKVAQPAGVTPASSSAKGLDYRTALDADQDTVATLEKDRSTYGDTRYSEGLAEANAIKFHTRLELDAPKVASKYDQFNPDMPDKFNAVAADAINRMYLSTVGYDPKTGRVANPDIRYSDYVESIMELADEVADRKVSAAKSNITKQVKKTGLRPGGNKAKRLNLNQDPSAMTDEELDAIIGQAIPSRKR